MVPVLERDLINNVVARPQSWRGRSGRIYALLPVRLQDFALAPDRLYLVALGAHVLWVGTADDLVQDAVSRARFRLALDCADRAYVLDAASDEVERMTVVWDLEGGNPTAGLNAA